MLLFLNLLYRNVYKLVVIQSLKVVSQSCFILPFCFVQKFTFIACCFKRSPRYPLSLSISPVVPMCPMSLLLFAYVFIYKLISTFVCINVCIHNYTYVCTCIVRVCVCVCGICYCIVYLTVSNDYLSTNCIFIRYYLTAYSN